jgi:hypothetical protein
MDEENKALVGDCIMWLSLETMVLIYVGKSDVIGAARPRNEYSIPVGCFPTHVSLVLNLLQMLNSSRSYNHATMKDDHRKRRLRVLKQN